MRLSFEDTSELWQGVDPLMQEMMEACQEFNELAKEHMKAGK